MCSGGGGGPSIGDVKWDGGIELTWDGNAWIDKAKEAAAAAEKKAKEAAAAAEAKAKAEAAALAEKAKQEAANVAAEIEKKKQEVLAFSDKNTQSIPTSEEIQGIISEHGEHYSLETRKFMGKLLGEDQYQGSMLDRMLEGDITMQEAIENQYQGGEVDQVLELGQFVWNEIDKLRKGETTETEKAGDTVVEVYEDTGEAVQTGLDNLEDVATDAISTSNETMTAIGEDVAVQFQEATGSGGLSRGVDETEGGEVVREEDLLGLGQKKSGLKAKKKQGKKGLRIDYGVSVPGGGKSGIAA